MHSKWYHKPKWIIVLLIIFYPVGLYLMWKYAPWTKKTKWRVTWVYAVLVVLGSIRSFLPLLSLASLLLLPFAIAKPSILNTVVKHNWSRRDAGFVMGGLTLGLFVLTGLTNQSVNGKSDIKQDQNISTPIVTVSSTSTPIPTIPPTQIVEPTTIPTVKVKPTIQPTKIQSAPQTNSFMQQSPQSQAPASSGFSCSGKTKCGQMNSCAEAKYYLNTCGVSRLDGDDDGVPCESICQ